MNTTGRWSPHQEIEDNPAAPFIKDVKKDMEAIDLHYNIITAKKIKRLMINQILNSL